MNRKADLPVRAVREVFPVISRRCVGRGGFVPCPILCRGDLAEDSSSVAADGDEAEHRRVRCNGQRLDEVQRTDEESEGNQREHEARVDGECPSPAEPLDELLLQQRDGEHAYARATRGKAVGKGSAFLEVETRGDDGADQDDAHADAWSRFGKTLVYFRSFVVPKCMKLL